MAPEVSQAQSWRVPGIQASEEPEWPWSLWALPSSNLNPVRQPSPAWCRCIGIDDELPGRKAVAVNEEQARAERFAELFRAVYLTFHRRDRPRSELPGASRAVLEHLALAGPLTIERPNGGDTHDHDVKL